MTCTPDRGSRAARAVLPAAFALAIALGGGAAAAGWSPAAAAQAAPPPASPSAPPFWARPRPATPDCACEEQKTEAPVARASRNPVVTGILGGAVLLLMFLLWRQRQKSAAADNLARALSAASSLPGASVPPPAQEWLDPRAARARPKAAGEAAKVPSAEELLFADPRAVRVELAEAEPEAESAGAKEFYEQIAASLTEALRKEPVRQDLRRKLLEIYFSARQTNEFVNLAHEYLDQNSGMRDQFWPDIGAMGARLAPDHELFQEWAADRADAGARLRPAARRVLQLRRFHERQVDQGKLYTAQQALIADFERLRADQAFQASLSQLLADSVRRPAPLNASPELAYVADGAQIFIKHEDRRRFHDDVMINVMGQMLVAQRLGRTRVITATRDGIHGHAVAGAAARLGLECMVYLAERDLKRYYARVLSMRRLGAHIRPIPSSPDPEPPDARRQAMEAWIDDPAKTQYISGLTGGPSPFPEMVREFQAVVGRETVEQLRQMGSGLPAAVVTSVCDGHLGLGLLQGFLDHPGVELYCVEEKAPAAGAEAAGSGGNGNVTLPEPQPCGQLLRREHRWLRDTQRINYVNGEDHETLKVIEQFHATGTTLFTESARTMAYARSLARGRERRDSVVVLLTNQEGADFRSARHDW